MTTQDLLAVDDYRLAADRYYDEATHLWADPQPSGRLRCGFDPLGSETSGDVVAVSFEPVGSRVARGEAFGSLEAAKFVGPLTAPVSGKITAHNAAAVADPGLINQDPLACWLIEIEADRPEEELALLLHGEEGVRAWFEREVERFKHQGMIAE